MTKLLLVDDESLAVEGIQAAVDWARLGVNEVYTAFDMHQAKEIFGRVPIDVMLCDIEMPQGSGLELLAWVREHYPRTESVFLTCHADFHYAKQAIQLGSVDYLLKPIPIPELENVIAKAIAKKNEEKEKTEYSQYGHYWVKHQPLIIERFWLDILNQSIPARPDAIRRAAEDRNIPYAEQMKFVPVLISVKRWYKKLKPREEKILEFALRNSAEELLFEPGIYGQLIQLAQGTMLAILGSDDAQGGAERLRQSCEAYIRSCRQYFYCDLCCYIGEEAHAYELPAIMDGLHAQDRNNVAFDNCVIRHGSRLDALEAVHEPEIEVWSVMMREGAEEKLACEVTAYLEALARWSRVDARQLHQFHQDFLQMMYAYLQTKGIQARQLFSDEKSLEMSVRAVRSVKDMVDWCTHLIGRAAECVRSVERSETVVDRVAAYVAQHLDRALTREEIAKQVYLNPDYLDRLFKKETGVSVTEHVVRERMTVAQSLLAKTSLPVHEVATRVGFTNFSHFARIFRKHTSRNPLEFRQEQQAGGDGRLQDSGKSTSW